MSVSTAPPVSAAPAVAGRRAPKARRRALYVLLLVVVALASAAAAYLVTRPAPARDARLPAGLPAEMSPAAAASVAAQVGHPVFGVPAQNAGSRLEVTRGSRGEVWVRYLAGAARPGDRRAGFLTVGSYPMAGALAAAKRAAEGDQMRSSPLPGGGIMLWSLERPTSVYTAQPGSSVLVEVYSPDAAQARALVRAGAVVALR